MVRSFPFGEADLIVSFFTKDIGRISAIARSARRPRRGLAPILEPMHTLVLDLSERPHHSLLTLSSSNIAVPRTRLTANLRRLDAAGTALRWVRGSVPARTPEPAVWEHLVSLLDVLDADQDDVDPPAVLAAAGLRLLRALGYGLNLASCVVCDRVCPYEQAACLDATRGGLICRACGGASRVIRSPLRSRMISVMDGDNAIEPEDAPTVLDVLDEAFLAHANVRV